MHLLFVPVHTHSPTGESLPAEGDSDRSRNKEKNTYFLLILLGTVGTLWDPCFWLNPIAAHRRVNSKLGLEGSQRSQLISPGQRNVCTRAGIRQM